MIERRKEKLTERGMEREGEKDRERAVERKRECTKGG